MFEKIDVNGDQQHPLFAELEQTADADGEAGDVKWNFEKFLVSPDGEVVGRFRPQVTPEDPALVSAIEAQLPSCDGARGSRDPGSTRLEHAEQLDRCARLVAAVVASGGAGAFVTSACLFCNLRSSGPPPWDEKSDGCRECRRPPRLDLT